MTSDFINSFGHSFVSPFFWHLLSINPYQDCRSNGRLNGIWRSNIISFVNKLLKTVITSSFHCGYETLTLLVDCEKRFRLSRPSAQGNIPTSTTCSTRQINGYGAKSASLWVHRSLFWQLSRDGNLYSLCASFAEAASSKPFWRKAGMG